MRPRTEFLSFRPPVSPADLRTRMPSSGYLLVTEPDSDEVAAAIALDELYDVPAENLDRRAGPVLYAPWCTPVAEALEMMRRQGQAVLAVVNEYGETVGILTFDDILDTIFSGAPSRSERLLRRAPIRQVAPGTWHVTGMASLRRLARYFHMQRPPSKSITVAGVVQEMLERIPLSGDQCRWGPFRFKVLDVPRRGQLLVELTMARAEDTPP
jgi:CBS domain containing-hemolysin-like protein